MKNPKKSSTFQGLTLSLALVLTTYLGLDHLSQSIERDIHNLRVQWALDLLQETPQGKSDVHSLFHDSTFTDQPISLMPKLAPATKSGAIDLADKKYQILTKKDLAPPALAHVISHELQHIEDHKIMAAVLNPWPNIKDRILKVEELLHRKNIQLALEDRPALNYTIETIYCSELRAYNKNLKLKAQGIVLDDVELTPQTREQHVVKTYLNSMGVNVPSERIKQLTESCEKAPNYALFQKTLLQKHFEVKL